MTDCVQLIALLSFHLIVGTGSGYPANCNRVPGS